MAKHRPAEIKCLSSQEVGLLADVLPKSNASHSPCAHVLTMLVLILCAEGKIKDHSLNSEKKLLNPAKIPYIIA